MHRCNLVKKSSQKAALFLKFLLPQASMQGGPYKTLLQGGYPPLHPGVHFLSRGNGRKARQRGGFLFGFSSEGHIPSGTSRSEVLSP